MTLAPTEQWDLDSILPEGPAGDAFAAERQRLHEALTALIARADALPPLADATEAWRTTWLDLYALAPSLHQLRAFALCHASADTRSQGAAKADAATQELSQLAARARVPLEAGLGEAAEAAFEAFVRHPELADIAPALRQRRLEASMRLSGPLEALSVELDRDGLHAWGTLYRTVSGKLTAAVALPGDEAPVTRGLAALAPYLEHPDRDVRERVFHASNQGWEGAADVCAATLTHITGARATRLARLGKQPLDPGLADNRLQQASLDTMWKVCGELQPLLTRYLARKAKRLGAERMSWFDLHAPDPGAGESELAYNDAQQLIIDAVGGFSTRMQGFVETAMAGSWVEAEQRDAKRMGGYCISMPLSQQSRIFMTFGKTLGSALTLAHELGHAYHNEVLFDVPYAQREVPMALAETASTLAEAVVRDALVKNASSDAQRLALLDQQCSDGVTFLMNIRARYLFELALYELRAQGMLTPDALSERMVACQKEAYADALADYNPMFWASKLHFHLSGVSFYNWPYTFGYLFSSAVYQRALEAGPAWADTYDALLTRTGVDTCEEVALQAFGQRLDEPEFWRGAMAPLRANLEQYLALTE